jgi:hypothetical protein
MACALEQDAQGEQQQQQADFGLDHEKRKDNPADVCLESESNELEITRQYVGLSGSLSENPGQLSIRQTDRFDAVTLAEGDAEGSEKAASSGNDCRMQAAIQAAVQDPGQMEFKAGFTNEADVLYGKYNVVAAPENISARQDWDMVHTLVAKGVADLNTERDFGCTSDVGKDLLLAQEANTESRPAAPELEHAAQKPKMRTEERDDTSRKETAPAALSMAAGAEKIISLRAAQLDRDALLAAVQMSKPGSDLERLQTNHSTPRTETSAARVEADQQHCEEEAIVRTLAARNHTRILAAVKATTGAAPGLKGLDGHSEQTVGVEMEASWKMQSRWKADTLQGQVLELLAII